MAVVCSFIRSSSIDLHFVHGDFVRFVPYAVETKTDFRGEHVNLLRLRVTRELVLLQLLVTPSTPRHILELGNCRTFRLVVAMYAYPKGNKSVCFGCHMNYIN